MNEPRDLDEILRVTVGSGLHGIAIEGTDDHDEMGVFIEDIGTVVGLDAPLNSDVWRTKPEGVRSEAGDTDLVRYSLRKYLRLATQGNPTVLLPLFAPQNQIHLMTDVGDELRDLAPHIVSKRAGPRFMGYMDRQIERLEGTRRSKPNRPELVERYGYDTKFASHAARLGMQGVELLSTGRLTLPMIEEERRLVRSIKQGEWTANAVVKHVKFLRDQLDLAYRTSPLLPEPDSKVLTDWVCETYLDAWSE